MVVGEAEDGRQAVALAASLKPDVVVLDIGMPNLNGIEAAKQISEGESGAAVVILSMYSDETYILRALKSGARGYLLKDSAESDLVHAIRSVAEKKSFFSPTVSRVLLEDYVRKLQRTGGESSYDLLTPRERGQVQQRSSRHAQPECLHRGNASRKPDGKVELEGRARADFVRGAQRNYFLILCLFESDGSQLFSIAPSAL
jgi:YesN/AraC family two-component response regulator